jgi:cyclomaltodextrinase
MTRLNRLLLTILVFSLLNCTNDTTPATTTTTEPVAANTDLTNPPQWAGKVIWYQIFVDRFHNGDPTNDPTIRDIEGAYPGFTPKTWAVTPWTHDWYKDDAYIADLGDGTDWFGNPITTFGQKSQMRRYGGDLQGVLDRMDYIEALGVTAIYFNPLNDAPSLHKYDPRHWRHIDRNFGPDPEKDIAIMEYETPDDPSSWRFTMADEMFLEVIKELHKRGIKVILDYSWNHTGHRFWAWEDLVENQAQSPYADWYWVKQFDDPKTEENEFDYRGWFGVVDLPEIKETEYHDHADAVKPFDGNLASETAKQHIFAVTKRWLDPNGDGDPSDGVDGFRLDVAAELPLGFWREYRKIVRAINPDAYLLGEVWWEKWPDKLLDPEVYLRGDIFDAVMNYRWYRAARHFFNAAPDAIPVSEFVDSLNRFRSNISPQHTYAMMNLNGSHDAPRVLTSLFNKNAYNTTLNQNRTLPIKFINPMRRPSKPSGYC